MTPLLTRRRFLQTGTTAAAFAAVRGSARGIFLLPGQPPLAEVGYHQVTVTSPEHLAQIENTRTILLGFSDDALMKPFRLMAGQDAPGEDIGGWYEYKADYNYKTGDAGLAPGASFGQWTSALARMSVAPAATWNSPVSQIAVRERVLRLNRLYAQTITPAYYTLTRLPAYSLDKTVCGLNDAHRLLGDPDAFAIMNRTTDAAVLALPGHPVDREVPWLPNRDISWNWDESPTLPENLYLAYSLGAGPRFLAMAEQYMDDRTFFTPLAANQNVLAGKHGYSYVNAMGSAMQAWLISGSEPHLRAAVNGFRMVEEQSFVTGGWAPDEIFGAPDADKLFKSLATSHNHFEAPCSAYAHMKLTRALLRVSRDGHYGDSMERVMYNSVLGALPLEADGHAYYFQDYAVGARRGYSVHRWPCCSGTLPQVAADYGINSYLREPGAVWVVLYIPSVLRWTEGGAQLSMQQSGSYPHTGDIRLQITASAPANFTLRLRIPGWVAEASAGPSLRINGQLAPVHPQAGFTSITRLWSTGDTVELTLPLPLSLVPIPGSDDKQHRTTVALRRGPLVLFPLGAGPHSVRERDALAARQTGPREFTVATAAGPVRFVPFTEVGDSLYSTYFQLH